MNYLPYQVKGIDFIRDKRVAIIADEMGLGKTVQAIGLINIKRYKRVLIICPASLKFNWASELERWLAFDLDYKIVKNSQDYLNADSLIINYDLIKDKMFKKLMSRQYDLIVIDEAHYLKGTKTSRTKLILGYLFSYRSIRRRSCICDKAKQVLLLSGTLVPNRPVELYPILSSLVPDKIDHFSYYRFAVKYCAGHQGRWGFNATGYSNSEILNEILYSGVMIRRLKKDVLPELPDKTYQIIELGDNTKFKCAELRGEKLSQYKYSMENDGHISTLRKDLALEKLDNGVKYIKSLLEGTEGKIVIFIHHREVQSKVFNALLSYNPILFDSSYSSEQRNNAVEHFKKDGLNRVIIGNLVAMGTGLNLTESSIVIFLEFSWVPGINEQCVDRCHRIGQKNNVLVQFLVYKNTLENNIIRSMLKKQAEIKKILE